MCAISCATTPCSSSRARRWSNPSVTAMCALDGSRPVENALGSGSGTIQILGFGSPAAMAISSTTLSSRLRAGRIEHPLGAVDPGVPRGPGGEAAGQEPDERHQVVVLPRRQVAGSEIDRQIAAEPDPGEEEHEPRDQPGGLPLVGLLLGEEVRIGHAGGLFIDRSTLGTARSPASSISHSSAGDALASPATRLVGNWSCFVLYWVATSL